MRWISGTSAAHASRMTHAPVNSRTGPAVSTMAPARREPIHAPRLPPTPTTPPAAGGVVINEVVTNPRDVDWNHDGQPAQAQWLELYNTTGATVCLARVPRCGICPLASACPSRGRRYEPLRKQSRFEGSFRQRRARTLRLVAESERPLSELDREAVESLAQDGLVEVADCGTLVTLP